MNTKICKGCSKELSIDMFRVDKKMMGGRTNHCKLCVNEKIREKNKLKKINGTYKIPDRKEYRKKYYKRNKEELKEASLKYYADHQEEKKEYQRKRRLIKKDYYKNYHKEWRAKNVKKLREYKHKKYHNDINHKIAHLLRSRFLETVKNNYKTESVLKLLGCTIDEFKIHIEHQFKPGMTWDNHGFGSDKWHFDHIVPCDFFDLTNQENQLKCFHYTNFQPLWQKDNLQKGSNYDSA